MIDTYLVQDINIIADANDPALDGVDSIIFEGNSIFLVGELQTDEVYLTSGDFPFMLVLGLAGAGFDGSQKFQDGTAYGFLALSGVENEFMDIPIGDFPYDGAIPLDLDDSSSEG